MAIRYDDLAKGLAHSISRKGKLRRVGTMLALAHLAAPARDAEVSDDSWDCLEKYVNALAECENTYSNAVGDADDAFFACVRSAKSAKEFVACFDQYDLALDNADLAFDGCEAAIAAKYMDCFGQV